MTAAPAELLRQALLEPHACLAWSALQWERLLQQARRANLLARLGLGFERAGLIADLPAGPRRHFEAIRRVTDSQRRAVRWELRQIDAALRGLALPVVLLKGAAYVMAEMPAADGRLFADIDILVPREGIAAVETSLMAEGWQSGSDDAYDQRYYRQWMHEIPPLQHLTRDSVIDVHHNILPLTGRIKVDAARLLERIVPLPGQPGFFRLGDADMVLHSACHLFLDGEFDKGLRDLVDLDALLRHFGAAAAFWPDLLARSQELGMQRVLFYALRYAGRLLATPIPAGLEATLASAAPPAWQLRWMDAIFERALRPDHSSCADRFTGAARRWLYLRAHWMRMPTHLLLMHLTVKALRREPEPA